MFGAKIIKKKIKKHFCTASQSSICRAWTCMYGFTNQQCWCQAFIPHCSWERTLISVIFWPQVCPLRMIWAEELGVCGTQSDPSSSAFCREHVLFCFHMCLVNTCSICACRHHTKESPSPGAWILSVTIILTEVRKTSTQNKKLYFSSQHSTPFPLKTNKLRIRKSNGLPGINWCLQSWGSF